MLPEAGGKVASTRQSKAIPTEAFEGTPVAKELGGICAPKDDIVVPDEDMVHLMPSMYAADSPIAEPCPDAKRTIASLLIPLKVAILFFT